MGIPMDTIDRISSQTIIADLALAEAHRLLARIDVEQHRELVDDHLGLRLADLQSRINKMTKLVDPRPLTDAELQAGQRRILASGA